MHTPGPWIAEPNAARGAWIKGANGEWAALACGDTDESAAHNARLIAAAPKLLAALKKCSERLVQEAEDSEVMPDEIARIIAEAELAINEAEGRTE